MTTRLTCRAFIVPLSPTVFRPIFQLQLPGVCSPEDKRLLPREPECDRRATGSRTDSRGIAKLALDEGQWHMHGSQRNLTGRVGLHSGTSRIQSHMVSPRCPPNFSIWMILTPPLEANNDQPVLPVGQAGGGRSEDCKSGGSCILYTKLTPLQGKETGDHGGIVRQKDTG